MRQELIRIWTEMDIEKVKKQLLLAGELSANCENCQHIGIDFIADKTCPQCQTAFKYIAFRKKQNKSEEFSAIRRLKEKRPDLIIVDYDDVKHASGKSRAQNIFD